jgi:hypothetical protein
LIKDSADDATAELFGSEREERISRRYQLFERVGHRFKITGFI